MQNYVSSSGASIQIVRNGFFYTAQSGNIVTFVRNKQITWMDNHTNFVKHSLVVRDQLNNSLLTIDKTGFTNFDSVIYPALVKSWKKFWGV